MEINNPRHSQRMAAICAIAILCGLLILLPIGGAWGDYMNSINAPESESNRFAEISTFDMDAKAFKKTGSYRSYWIAKNSTGKQNYYNVTHTAGVISVATADTNGKNNISGSANYSANVSWSQMHPYFEIYFDYTALQAYKDNAVRIRLYISNIYVAANAHARTITLSAGGVTLYTETLAQTDTDNKIDHNITIDVNDHLRQAIINSGNDSFFKLVVTAQDPTLSIAGCRMYAYNCNKLVSRDDALYLVVGIATACAFAGIFLVQPKYSLPMGSGQKRKSGGY